MTKYTEIKEKNAKCAKLPKIRRFSERPRTSANARELHPANVRECPRLPAKARERPRSTATHRERPRTSANVRESQRTEKKNNFTENVKSRK